MEPDPNPQTNEPTNRKAVYASAFHSSGANAKCAQRIWRTKHEIICHPFFSAPSRQAQNIPHPARLFARGAKIAYSHWPAASDIVLYWRFICADTISKFMCTCMMWVSYILLSILCCQPCCIILLHCWMSCLVDWLGVKTSFFRTYLVLLCSPWSDRHGWPGVRNKVPSFLLLLCGWLGFKKKKIQLLTYFSFVAVLHSANAVAQHYHRLKILIQFRVTCKTALCACPTEDYYHGKIKSRCDVRYMTFPFR